MSERSSRRAHLTMRGVVVLSTMFEFILLSSNCQAVTRVFALGPDMKRVIAFEHVWAVAFGWRRNVH
jgi:hypothetical protein